MTRPTLSEHVHCVLKRYTHGLVVICIVEVIYCKLSVDWWDIVVFTIFFIKSSFRQSSLKRKCHDFHENFATGYTISCQNDSFQRGQWWKFRQNGISVSVLETVMMAIWWHRSGATLAQVMACCLTTPSHYLDQCWLIVKEIVWHSTGSNFTGSWWRYAHGDFSALLALWPVNSPQKGTVMQTLMFLWCGSA